MASSTARPETKKSAIVLEEWGFAVSSSRTYQNPSAPETQDWLLANLSNKFLWPLSLCLFTCKVGAVVPLSCGCCEG